ncbi:MAG TPA: hypothetical protein VJ385_22525 [Fibrobacteria bacterium]|nr:hypothetical protein [Fibrobacteria bacterium]
MLTLTITFAAFCLILGLSFYRKYEARLRSEAQNTLRYSRIADYFGRPILLTFEYRLYENQAPSLMEADVDEIYHYGRDYFLKGYSPDGKRCRIYKWSRISNPRIRYDGRYLDSLEALFLAAENGGPRAAA